ncbi:MAG: DUF1257 domain-containing protein [Caldilineaceae bacterium]|nr:DUF1257 domain-containing protein [Caldilineaceae bacterium]
MMSKFVKVSTELRDLNLIKRSLDDLKLTYREDARYTHIWSGSVNQVPVLVESPKANFGLRQTETGIYEAVGDDMQMRAIRSTLDQVQQRYAYHKVVAETALAGFDLVEESVGRDNVIRMTVRRWS